jgi:transcriptional regulator with XRE-family HTH domain
MGTRAVEKGRIAEAVAENVEAVRRRRGLSQQQLATRLAELGRPMQASAVAKVESGDRRVDVDDLAAFAVALNVPVARLLLPDVDEDGLVEVVPAYSVPMWSAWQWATAERSLWSDDDDGNDPEVQRRDLDFVAERPVWLRLREQQELSRAVRHLSWVAGRVLASLPGTPRGKGEKPASGAGVQPWLRKVDQALEGVRREVDQLKDEVEQRG